MRALRELDRRLDELHAADRAAQEWARFELARSASRFTRRTQKVVDDTVSLSATLMRAGEVTEASRLIEEAEIQVRTEEAALIETVNEVRAAGEVRRRRMTKLRVAKAFATMVLSGSMFAFSAFGVALARFALETAPEPAIENGGDTLAIATPRSVEVGFHEIEVAPGVSLKLSLSDVKTLSRLTNSGDEDALRAFLAVRLPPALVERVQEVLLLSAEAVTQRVPVEGTLERIERASRGSAETPAESEDEPADEPSPPQESPTPDPDQQPETNPSPSDEEPEDQTPLEGLPIPFDDDGG